ncbi:xanthine dehydrogenase family protein subunit M [Elioraea sp.]|uniref:FAD binding domain-containing protein n=1 Tax=Elioraea sp. TaxID=2185103 RepID=UPI0025C1347F|nr:FAD binding domain-containing protein [Elioraea sp.]
MKAAAFDLVRPRTVADALAALADGARPLAGGQSLGPMLNFRLATPERLADIRTLAALRAHAETDDTITWGAAVTHAEVEDGRVPDPTGGTLRAIAGHIAYRAVRNRGTVGGSLAHADPAADWISALTALGGSVRIAGPEGEREEALTGWMSGAFATQLAEGELLLSVTIPRPRPGARLAYRKLCRKEGEFAMAIAAVLDDPARAIRRVVVGATDGAPIIAEGADAGPRAHAAIDAWPGEAWKARLLHVSLDRALGDIAA